MVNRFSDARAFLGDDEGVLCRYCGSSLRKMIVETGDEIIFFGWKASENEKSWAVCDKRPFWQKKLGCWTHRPRKNNDH